MGFYSITNCINICGRQKVPFELWIAVERFLELFLLGMVFKCSTQLRLFWLWFPLRSLFSIWPSQIKSFEDSSQASCCLPNAVAAVYFILELMGHFHYWRNFVVWEGLMIICLCFIGRKHVFCPQLKMTHPPAGFDV